MQNKNISETLLNNKYSRYEEGITFFIPCYNEEKNIEATIENVLEAVRDCPMSYEMLIFDDASVDNTIKVVEQIMADRPELPIRIVRSKENRGLGFNYSRGSFFAKMNYYMLINGDNVEPAEAIRETIKYCGQYDMVIPYFGNQEKRSLFRKIVSQSFSFIVNILSGHKIHYYNGAVLHMTDNVRFWRAETIGYGYQAELVCRLLHEGATYTQVEVPNTDRQWGFSKAFALSNILSVSNSLYHIFWRRLEYMVFHLLKPGVTNIDTESESESKEDLEYENTTSK